METKAEQIRRAFRKFHAGNPQVWDDFCKFTFQLIKKGFSNYSAYAVMHRVRWESAMSTSGDPFKINNNFVPHYARLFHEVYPAHAGFFETRELITESRLAA